MAEFVIGPLVSMVKDKASNYLLDQYKVMEGMEEQRKVLERKLPAILVIIQDAENKGGSQPGVAAWLQDLKTAAYEANDVFDEFNYEALRREAKKKGHHSKLGTETVRLLLPSRNPIVFRYRMGKKLRRIVQTIEVLVNEMNTFGFRHLQEAPLSRQWRQTDHIIDDFDKDIISKSRGQEKKEIVRKLLDEASNMSLMVLPIVGPGGMGKTTFVQLIYNDPAIEKHFELRRWCCVSEDFDVGTIASNISQISEKNREKALKELQATISGKRYLIVLDDVWNRDAVKWGKLKTCLKMGCKGSAVLTTTRDSKVAEIMRTGVDESYSIEKLSDEHLREIIHSRAFNLQKPNSNELDDIVGGIVRRCVGSPLAAKAFGSMLNTRTTINEWKDVLDKSNIFNERTEILPILKLSFDDLPSHMKQCFSFCAIFPKDYEIDVEELIQLWMAHDFIPVQEGEQLETVGDNIFKELTWRSFFQDVRQTLRTTGFMESLRLRKRTICKIHDFMHDIALSVIGRECATIVDKQSINKLTNPTRHLFLSWYAQILFQKQGHAKTLFDDFLKKRSSTLQTMFCSHYQNFNVSNCTSLRALHLPGIGNRTGQIQLPGNIQHLRYLNLSGIQGLEKLPESISIMYNLQTLNVSHCLELFQLPKDMKFMASLRNLYTSGCRSLTGMPPGLGQITSLQTLSYFAVGASSGCSTIGELRNLNLGGELELIGLENVTEVLAKAASLENKEKLTHLSFKWNGDARDGPDCHKVLDALKPHNGLQMLKIVNYKGTSLPSWITDPSMFQHLAELHLLGFVSCEEFPQFCRFEALQVLYLENLNNLLSLALTPFPKLKELHLHDLINLERWVATEGKEDELTFPVLEEVDIKNCPKLTSMPEAPKLKVLRLDEGKALLSLVLVKSRLVSSLSKLQMSIHETEAIPPQIDQSLESSLSKLELEGCHFFFPPSPSQPTFGIWKWFGQLVDLTIANCDVLMYWPEQVFQSLVSLKILDIRSCNKLIGPTQVKFSEPTNTTVQFLPHLNSVYIENCKMLSEIFILPPSLRVITISGCPMLEYIWEKEVQQPEACATLEYGHNPASTSVLEKSQSPKNRRPSLRAVHLFNCGSMVTLPDLPPSLQALIITDCQELCSVSGQLDALEILEIRDCGKLESLNSLGDLPSLEDLYLSRCRCLSSIPGGRGNYSSLRELSIRFCPAIDEAAFQSSPTAAPQP